MSDNQDSKFSDYLRRLSDEDLDALADEIAETVKARKTGEKKESKKKK